MADSPEVLSVSTVVRRRSVTIDDKKIELLNQDELRLDASVRCREVLAAFRDRSRISEEGALILAKNLVRTVRDVLPGLPPEIDAKLSDEQRINIMVAFFQATPAPAASTAEPLPVQS